VLSVPGFGGGYSLARDPGETSLVEFLALFEERTNLTDCCGGSGEVCERHDQCEIRRSLAALNTRIAAALEALTLADLLNLDGRTRLRDDATGRPARSAAG